MCEFSNYNVPEAVEERPSHASRVAAAKQLGAEMPWVDGWIDEAIEPWIDQRKRGAQGDL